MVNFGDFDPGSDEMGRYQVAIVMMFLAGIGCISMSSQSAVFTSAVPKYWCKATYIERALRHQYNESDIPDYYKRLDEKLLGGCYRYSDNFTGVCLTNFSCYSPTNSSDVQLSKCADGYYYDDDVFQETTVSEWNLVCGDEIFDVVANSMLYLGFLIGSAIVGPLADRYGRKPTMAMSNLVFGIFFCSLYFAPNIYIFALLRMAAMAANMTYSITNLTFCNELATIKTRTSVGILFMASSAFGSTMVSVIAYNFRHWRDLVLTIGIIMSMFLPAYLVIPESPRWQFTKRKYSCAYSTIKKFSRNNEEKLNKDKWEQLISDSTNGNTLKHLDKYSFLDLFRYRNTRILTFMAIFLWFVSAMVFFGLGLNVGALAGDPYLNAALNGFVEILGNICLFVVTAKTKLKSNIIVSFNSLCAGLCCLLATVVTECKDIHIAATVIAIIGKFFATISFNLLFILTTEIYPTAIRSTGVGIASVAGRLGSTIMPFVLFTQNSVKWVTMALFGSQCVVAAIVALFLPSSRDLKYFNNLEEAEQYYAIHMKKVFSFWTRSKKDKSCGMMSRDSTQQNQLSLGAFLQPATTELV